MSKFVKYISSDHFGAPVIKADRWGYCVEMLRKTLVEGFNERTDLTSIKVIDANKFEATFTTAHNYVANQTIKISNVPNPELNGDAFIESVDGLVVTCLNYNDLTGMIGQTATGTFKSIVAPLGFIEKFKDGNRSAFTTDEEEAFFYIDDRDGGTKWKNASNGSTNIICPIVFMTDKMINIDTPGSLIVPYDSANPDFYKKVDYTIPGYTGPAAFMGIFTWLTCGAYTNTSTMYPNTTAQQQTVTQWEIIGNGRLFYFMPKILGGSSMIVKKHIYAFGKFNGSTKTDKFKNYVLIASQADCNNTNNASYSYRRVTQYGSAMPLNNLMYNNTTNQNWLNTDIGKVFSGVLSVNNKTSACFYLPSNLTRSTGSILTHISGLNGNYPDAITKKYYVQQMNIYTPTSDFIGELSGFYWTYNSSSTYNADGRIYKYNFKNKSKKMYTFNNQMNGSYQLDPNDSSTTTYVYNISLEYEDWKNYE